MNTHRSIHGLALAMGLLAGLAASTGWAALVVTGGSDTAEVGQDLFPTVTLSSDGATDEVALSQVEAWTFRLDWGAAPLSFDEAGSTMVIGGATYTLPQLYSAFLDPNSTGFLVSTSSGPDHFAFFYEGFLNLESVDLTGGFEFTAKFTGSAPGTYPVTFSTNGLPSSLSDNQLSEFPYSVVSQGQLPMEVTVTQQSGPPAVPEPGALALLAGGLLALGQAGRRRRD